MSKDKFILSLWEKEKMDALKELAIIEDAEKRGLTNGMAKGIEQGIEQSKKEIVLNMHNKNFQVEDISEITNLSISEVETIINEFSNNSK